MNSHLVQLSSHSALYVTQKELLCKLIGLSPAISDEAFEEAIYENIGKDDFRMETLKW